MFTPISMAGTGAIITILETVLRLFGIEFPEGSVANAVQGGVAVVGLILLVWGQLRRKDLDLGIFRKVE